MNILAIIGIALAIFFEVYALVDRICKCIEFSADVKAMSLILKDKNMNVHELLQFFNSKEA